MVGGPSTSDDPPATDPGVPRDLEWPPPLMTSPSPRRRDPRMGARLRKTATAVGRFSGPPPQPFLYPLPPSPPPLLQGITGRAGGRPTSFNHGAEGERRQQRPMQSRNCVFCCFFFFALGCSSPWPRMPSGVTAVSVLACAMAMHRCSIENVCFFLQCRLYGRAGQHMYEGEKKECRHFF